MTAETKSLLFLPPRWFVRAAWVIHRPIHRFTGGREPAVVLEPRAS